MRLFLAAFMMAGIFLMQMGCQNTTTRAGEGAAIGGVLGALAGGIIGHQDDEHGLEGAAIGAAAGVVTGAVVGSQIEKKPASAAAMNAAPAKVAQTRSAGSMNQIPLQTIVELTKQGVHEDVIIDRIKLTSSRYSLAESDMAYLRDNGVSQKVIDAMKAQ
jgi:hypothetical protein